jgi:predicted transcriptional regulator
MPSVPPSAPRRGSGRLESAVLDVLWQARRPLSPGEVQAALGAGPGADGPELSYSTVVTILTRLHEKKVLVRHRDGRAFRYEPVADEAGLAARRLAAMLDGGPDRQAVLSRFVADLSESDEALLRRLLGEAGPGPD